MGLMAHEDSNLRQHRQREDLAHKVSDSVIVRVQLELDVSRPERHTKLDRIVRGRKWLTMHRKPFEELGSGLDVGEEKLLNLEAVFGLAGFELL